MVTPIGVEMDFIACASCAMLYTHDEMVAADLCANCAADAEFAFAVESGAVFGEVENLWPEYDLD